MKVLLWGTYDTSKPRNRILLHGLQAAGAEVSEIHRNVWADVKDKSQLTSLQIFRRALRWIFSYPVLLTRFLIAPKPAVILLLYPAQIDVLVLWLAARLRGVPIILDLFISVYDTVVLDRGMVSPRSLTARLIRSAEWLACRAADGVIIDTAPHARHVEELFALRPGSVGFVPVGVEPNHFPLQPKTAPSERPRLLFYGQLIPLHGIGTVIEAALSPRGGAYDWTIIGTGQDSRILESALEGSKADNISWLRWLPYEDLKHEIARADLCLGIFGTSRKAASVVPNKVYQCLASGRHVVTRTSPAMRELAPCDESGLTLVDAGSANALLKGVEAALAAGANPPSEQLRERFSTLRIGQMLIREMESIR